jgi:hypothetical protein
MFGDCSFLCLIALLIVICIGSCRKLKEAFVVTAPWPYDKKVKAYDDNEELSLSAYPRQKEVFGDEASAWGEYRGNVFPCGQHDPGCSIDSRVHLQRRNGEPQSGEPTSQSDACKTCKKGETWGVGFDLVPDGNLDPGFTGAGGQQDPEGGPASLLKARKEVAPRGHPYRRQEHIGYRWTESWRPYYWKNYPNPPIWFPARNPAAGEPEMPQDPAILKMMDQAGCRKGLAAEGTSPQGYKYFWKLRPPYEPLCSDFADKACRNQPYPHFCYRRAYGKCIHGAL